MWFQGGLVVVVIPGGHRPVAIHRHWGGRRASLSAHALRYSFHSGAGFKALGPGGSSGVAGESRIRWTPLAAVTYLVPRKVCTPSCASGAGRGEQGTGAAP